MFWKAKRAAFFAVEKEKEFQGKFDELMDFIYQTAKIVAGLHFVGTYIVSMSAVRRDIDIFRYILAYFCMIF